MTDVKELIREARERAKTHREVAEVLARDRPDGEPGDWDARPTDEVVAGELREAAFFDALSLALEQAIAGAEWRPIETAPKDDSVLIAGGTFYEDASMHTTEWPFTGVTIARFDDRAGEWSAGYGKDYDQEYWHRPTHWRPLPSPPEPSP